jgi:glutamine synthetase adenylyltransferase
MKKIESRITKIEQELRGRSIIPSTERSIVFFPEDTEETRELRLKEFQDKLNQKYGEDLVSNQDIIVINVVYDNKPITNDLAYEGMKRTSIIERHMEKQNVTEVYKKLSELSDEQLDEIIGDEMKEVFATLTDEQLKEIVKTGKIPNDI